MLKNKTELLWGETPLIKFAVIAPPTESPDIDRYCLQSKENIPRKLSWKDLDHQIVLDRFLTKV